MEDSGAEDDLNCVGAWPKRFKRRKDFGKECIWLLSTLVQKKKILTEAKLKSLMN